MLRGILYPRFSQSAVPHGVPKADSSGALDPSWLPSSVFRYKGWFIDSASLIAAYPTGVAGDYATVGSGTTGPSVWAWDDGTSAWEDTASSGLVTSVFGRTGDVAANALDYAAFYDALGAGAAAVTAHELAYNHANLHTRLHALNDVLDHSGNLDATQMPVSGTWSLTGGLNITGASVVFNSGGVDSDFSINGNGGNALKYDYGDNSLTGRFFNLTSDALNNTFVGVGAAASVATGTGNTCVGYATGYSLTTGHSNTTLGKYAGESLTTGYRNVAIGHSALDASASGQDNVVIGYYAAHSNYGSNSVFVGYQSGYGTLNAGANNSGFGVYSLFSIGIGNNNLAVGDYAGYNLTSGNHNAFVGHYAGSRHTTETGRLVVDSYQRADLAAEQADSIIYGVMSASGAASQSIQFNVASLTIPSTAYNYYGDPATDGTWRIGRSGDDLVIERRESGSYVTKGGFSA